MRGDDQERSALIEPRELRSDGSGGHGRRLCGCDRGGCEPGGCEQAGRERCRREGCGALRGRPGASHWNMPASVPLHGCGRLERMMPTPPLAYHDPRFIDSDEGRPVRIVSEYLAPLRAFAAAGVSATVVFFGSARARAGGVLARYYEEALELARLVTQWSRESAEGRLIVCSGGGPGIMEAANRGAALAGGRSVGLNIGLPQEQRPNPYITPELSFEFHYFFMRKLWFAHLAHALVAFPGGFGTLGELFEILTLAQTGKLERRIPVIIYGSAYWKEIVNFDALVRHGTIGAEDLNLFKFADDPAAALKILQDGIVGETTEAAPDFAHSRC